MNAVITASYLAVYGLVQIAMTEYKTVTVQVQRGYDSNGWKKFKRALKEAISFPHHNHY